MVTMIAKQFAKAKPRSTEAKKPRNRGRRKIIKFACAGHHKDNLNKSLTKP